MDDRTLSVIIRVELASVKCAAFKQLAHSVSRSTPAIIPLILLYYCLDKALFVIQIYFTKYYRIQRKPILNNHQNFN